MKGVCVTTQILLNGDLEVQTSALHAPAAATATRCVISTALLIFF